MKVRQMIPMLLLVTALCVTAAQAQTESWQNKPYSQWTKDEARKVLNESPWALRVERSIPIGTGSAGNIQSKAYTLRLRSALPIRQALLRLRQLDEKYDKMDEKKKAEFDEKNKPLIECPACVDNYVVTLSPPAGADTRTVTLDKMKLFVRLVDERGRARQLVHFTAAKTTGAEITFFFPRLDEKNEPLLTPASKKLIFTIDTSVVALDTMLWRFEFDVAKMLSDGKVVF